MKTLPSLQPPGCNLANCADKEGELGDDDQSIWPLTLERVATERNGVHHCAGRPEKSRLFRIILADDYARATPQPVLVSNFCGSFLQTKA